MSADLSDTYKELREQRKRRNARRFQANEVLRAGLAAHPRWSTATVQRYNNNQQWRVVFAGLTMDYWPATGLAREPRPSGPQLLGCKRETLHALLRWMESQQRRTTQTADELRAAEYDAARRAGNG